MISEVKIEMLLKLIKAKKITINDIKNDEYKAEVEKRLNA
ncbi:hypothetical protein CLTEP_02130 [Clostridium tepidiprofundi DSM 19306]|uniref:Uncharacterized protein n=1 Tax=Clostridium tepidiprofundi DSM 19306 TaxID=1121338 RepID=A0A151B7Q8_9CLOT|nr:hypothetical protein CLTEP_02130 [Clostridium tepidiprofundi DSM 19306]